MLTNKQIESAVVKCVCETNLNDGSRGRGGGSLQLRIRKTTAGVSAAWFATWKKAGKRGSKQLGRYPDMGLVDARTKFDADIRPLVQASAKPKVAFVQQAISPTVENMFKQYVAKLRARSARSADHIEHVLLLGKYNAADALGRDTLAGDVTPADIRTPLADGAKRGALRTADILRTYLSAAFNWAIKCANDYTTEENYDWGIKANPVTAVPRDGRANKTRNRNLQASEMHFVWHAGQGEQSNDVMRLIMLCGQRVQETVRVDGIDIDLDGAMWNMPPEKTKGGDWHSFPIPHQAVEIFRRLKDECGDGPLFPARSGSKTERMGWLAVTHAAARVQGVADFTPRDLRRTWKSRAGEIGIDRFTRDLIQQHAKGDTGSKNYDFSNYLPMLRDAMKLWGEWFEENVINVVETQQRKMAA